MTDTAIIEKSTHFESGQLSYAVAGSQNQHTLCFMPGWGGNRHLLYEVAQAFANQYKVIVAEFPGFRDSQLSAPYSIDHTVEALAHILAEEETNQVTLLGHSMGGAIALSYAAKYPKNIDQIIGIDCYTYPTIYPRQPAEVVKGFIAAIADDFKAGLAPIIDMSCNQYTSEASKQKIIETFHCVDPEFGLAMLKECLEWDMIAMLNTYQGKVSTIVANLSYDEKSFRETCPDHIEVIGIDECAHFIAQDQPQRLIEAISSTLD